MYYTAEIRWFSRHSQNLRYLFDRLPGEQVVQPERDDHYLKTGIPTLNLKYRDALLEIKWLLQPASPFRLGELEHWVKLSMDCGRQDLPPGEWIAIHKSRLIKKYRFTDQHEVEPVAFDQFFDSGCFAEFTELGVSGKRFYTLNFEAFGTQELTMQILKTALVQYSGNLDLNRFSKATCQSYAAFLLTL